MASTSPWNIPLFDDTMAVAPLQSILNSQSSALNDALDDINANFKKLASTPVSSAAARSVIYPTPVQGNAVYRTDLGYEERYFSTYNASSNKAGATPSGWYPMTNAGPYFFGQKTVDQNIPSGTGTQLTWNVDNSIGLTASTAGSVTIPVTGWYRVTANLGGFSTPAGNNRWLYVTKNSTTDQPRIISVTTTTASPGDNLWNATEVMNFVAGDILRMYGLQDSGSTARLNGSSLAVEWVGHSHG